MPPPLPTSAGAAVKRTLLAVPVAPRLAPLKFTVAVATRASAAAVRVDEAVPPPVPTALLIVEWPPARVIVPTVSLEATFAVLLPTKARVPPRKVIDAVSGRR